ncbi:MAG: MG2 domain-containing protein [Elusimicrobiota bacterium]|nr:MG2 domain-containing protein [Elusimicrobiota bacterium]
MPKQNLYIYRAWNVETGDKSDYKTIITKIIDPPELEAGFYLVVCCADNSFKISTSIMQACFLNVTNLVLAGTAGVTTKSNDAYYDFIGNKGPDEIHDDAFRFYAFDAKTGQPVQDVDLDIFVHASHRGKEFFEGRSTDKKGVASLSLLVGVSPHDSDYYNVDPLAKIKNSFAFWRSQKYLNYSPPNPIQLFLETDRPIYRPGHTVQAKVVVLRRISQGFKTLRDREVQFTAHDPNYKEFFTETVKLNEFGSASVSFDIPQGRLLGSYELSAECTDGSFNNSTGVYFSVEEYKRPEFEIILKPADEPWKYEKSVKIRGQAQYYFGGPVPNAPVAYRIKRLTYIPWYYRGWFGQDYYSGVGEEIATGEIKTDAEGNFVIPFIPAPSAQGAYWGSIPDISQFIVEVDGRDAGGRTIEAQQSYRAGTNGIYFVIEPKKGFFLEKKHIEIESKRLTINDTPAQGKGGYEVFRLSSTPTKPLSEIESYYGNRGEWGWIPPLDVQLKDVPNDTSVAKGVIEHDKDGKSLIKIASLPQGAYRIREKSKDQWGGEVTQDKIFVVAKNTKEAVPVNAPSVLLVENDEYRIGEKARFIIGSGLGSGIYHIEIWAGQHLLRTELIVADARQGEGNHPVRLIEIPVTERLKGGFTLRWFGAKGLDINYGQTTVSVPWVEKKLEVSLEPFTKELKPGEEVTWGVLIKDLKGKSQDAEVLALMYDRSLEYYIQSQNPWLDNLYALRPAPVSGCDSIFDPYVITLPITEGLLAKILKAFGMPVTAPVPPGLRTWRTWTDIDEARHAPMGSKARMQKKSGEALPSSMEMIEEAEKGKPEPAPEKVKTRKEFADTAFFKPHIVTGKDGKGRFSFIAPEQLTSWRIKLFGFTEDVKEGRLSEEAVTKKELMVRVDIPRFFREKDKGTVTAIVHNESEKTLKGELLIDITEHDTSIYEKLKLKEKKKQFVVKPHSLESFDWMIEIPEGVSTYRVRAVAIADKLSDAEERDLPILPSRQRLIESVFTALSGSVSKKLEIALKDDPTRINESMILQVDPQLALSILNTIPFLVEYPFDCVEQILNRYVPLSIVNEIYKKYPAIKEAVGKIPKRKTVTPPWEKDDPKRLITLMETPWVWQSEGRPTIWPIIDLLDPEIVKAEKDITFDKLQSAQLSDGAFPWWPGGRADAYMTLYVLAGLAEARRYGVDVPEDMIQRALGYVNKEIPLRLKAEARFLSLVSYAAYVVTSYSTEEFSEAKKGHEAARFWVKFLEKHIHALTPFGKAYLAYTYLRLGDRKRAGEVLDMAMDGSREDPIAGVYWTPEKYSWVWYSDTVEKHAFLLRTLQELRPKDERIPGMVQWLLFNRKGTVWKSTKASVAAVYALLDFLNKSGALGADETFNIQWGKDKYSVVVKADDWLDEPIRWQEKGFEITKDETSATVDKKGPGLAFASLTWTYSTDQLPEASTPGMLALERKFYRRIKEGKKYHLKPIKSGEKVSVGDQIEVQIKINTRSQFEYMHLKDPKVSGFEAETLLSGWKYDPLWFYEEPRDSLTNFFMDWLPHGEYILRYRLRPTKPGVYRVGAATLQSMYSPEMTAHSAGFIVVVK